MERSEIRNLETWKKGVPWGESKSESFIAPSQDRPVIRAFTDKYCTIGEGITGRVVPRKPHHELIILRIKGDTQIFFLSIAEISKASRRQN
jgi:hypothetical protein